MAKKDLTKSDGASTAVDTAPVFSSDALSKLTAAIQTGFEKTKNGQPAAKETKKEKHDRKKKEKKERQKAAPKEKAAPKDKAAPAAAAVAAVAEKKPPAPSRTRAPLGDQDGEFSKAAREKRQQNQPKPAAPRTEKKEFKPTEKTIAAWKPQRTKPGTQYETEAIQRKTASQEKATSSFPKKSTGRIDKDALLKEIVELGGNAEDLALVEGIESDDDQEEVVIESGKAKDIKKNDIEAFMKEIGLQAGKLPEMDDDEEDEEEEEEEEEEQAEEEEEEEEEEEDEEEEEEETKDVEMADVTAAAGDKKSKLVRCSYLLHFQN